MKFQIGDIVEVANVGNSYTSYDQMADWVGLTNYTHECAEYKKFYRIVGMKKHENGYSIVVGIVDTNGNGYLVGEKGLDLVNHGKFREGDVIEIDGEQLVVDLEIPFNEDDAKLISRKQLI